MPRRLGITLVIAWCTLLSCAAPATPPSQPEATIGALQTQVRELALQVPRTATVTIPPPTRIPLAEAPEVPAPATDEVELEAASLAEPEPTSTPTPAPTPRPTAFPTRTPRPLTAEDAAPCDIGQIKGNRDSKIYHVPTGGSYARTKNKVDCFTTEAEAQAAGYRRARN
jgi:hypothetical protein